MRSNRLALIAGTLGAAAIGLGIWTSVAGAITVRHRLPQDVRSPILALELIRDPTQLEQIAPPPEAAAPGSPVLEDSREQLAGAVRTDFAFIAAYGAFLVALGIFGLETLPRRLKVLGVVVIVLGVGAAVADVLENVQLLRLLSGEFGDPRSPSVVKWSLLFIAILCSVPMLVDRRARPFRRSIGYVGVALALAAGIGGLVGLAAGDDKVIEAAVGRLSATFAIATIFLLTRRVLAEGVLPALNRLAASSTWTKKLADWPSGNGSTVPWPE